MPLFPEMQLHLFQGTSAPALWIERLTFAQSYWMESVCELKFSRLPTNSQDGPNWAICTNKEAWI